MGAARATLRLLYALFSPFYETLSGLALMKRKRQ